MVHMQLASYLEQRSQPLFRQLLELEDEFVIVWLCALYMSEREIETDELPSHWKWHLLLLRRMHYVENFT